MQHHHRERIGRWWIWVSLRSYEAFRRRRRLVQEIVVSLAQQRPRLGSSFLGPYRTHPCEDVPVAL